MNILSQYQFSVLNDTGSYPRQKLAKLAEKNIAFNSTGKVWVRFIS